MCGSKYFAGILLIGSLCFFGNLSSASDFGTQLTTDGSYKRFTDWSPDGKWIAYAMYNSEKLYDIWIISPEGDNPENLTNNISGMCFLPKFSIDSEYIYFTHSDNDGWDCEIWRINIKTKGYTVFMINALNTCISHDGRYFAYRVGNTSELMLFDSLLTEYRSFGGDDYAYGVSCFTPDNKYIITTQNVDGMSNLFMISIETGASENITPSISPAWYPDCIPGSNWVIYCTLKDKIMAYNLNTKESIEVFRGMTDPCWCGSPSPDLSRVCYLRNIGGVYQLFVGDFHYAPIEIPSEYGTQITNNFGSKWFTDWSPDGKWIAYSKYGNIWIVPSAGGGEPRNITVNIKESCIFPCFTADSNEICFDQPINDGSGNLLTRRLAKINIYTGEYSPILNNAVHTAWSHNGQYLAYQEDITADWYVLDTVNNKTRFLADGATILVFDKNNAYTLSCFTPDDSYIITTMYDGAKLSLFKIPVMGGEREQLTSHEGYQWYPDCSSDGEWILYTNFSIDYVQKKLYAYNTLLEVSMPVFPELTFRHWCASFSPDGTKFSYLKGNEINSNSSDVFVANFPFQSQDAVVPAINKLIEEINKLVAIGDLDKGIGNALISKLNESVKAINKGNSNSAINQLEAFINQVEALKGKKLSAEQADKYIGTIRKVINVLSKQAELAKINVPAGKGAKKEIVIADPYSLKQNSPNPFNPTTTISFTVYSVNNEPVLLNIYDIRGSLVRRLVNESKAPGVHSIVWDGKDDSGSKVSAGIYFCRMQAGQFSKTNKMILMK